MADMCLGFLVLPAQVQLLLFSATFNDNVKNFAMQISPQANHVFVAKEQLSLDVIAQFVVKWVRVKGVIHKMRTRSRIIQVHV